MPARIENAAQKNNIPLRANVNRSTYAAVKEIADREFQGKISRLLFEGIKLVLAKYGVK